MRDQFLALDPPDELGVETQDAVEPQDVGDEVVGEHRQPVEIVKPRDTGAGEVGGGDLGALEEWDRELAVARAVGEALPGPEPRREPGRGGPGGVGDRGKATVVFGGDMGAEVTQRSA